VIVPFAVGPDRVLLARIAPGIVWIAAFLAMLLGHRATVPRRSRGWLADSAAQAEPAAQKPSLPQK
jgi:heme exporter protein B